MAFLVKVVVEVCMDTRELLQGLHLPEPEHCPLPSSERRVAVLHPVLGPAADRLLVGIAELRHRCPVGFKSVGCDGAVSPMRTRLWLTH